MKIWPIWSHAPEGLVAIAPDLRFRRPNFEFQSSLITPPDINHVRPNRRVNRVFLSQVFFSLSIVFVDAFKCIFKSVFQMYWFSGNTNLLQKFSQSWGCGTNSRCREASWDGFWMALLDQIWKLLSWEGKCVKVKLKSIYLLLSNRYTSMYLITINGLFFHSFYWINFICSAHSSKAHELCKTCVFVLQGNGLAVYWGTSASW